MTLLQQFWIRTSPKGVTCITLYLFLSAGLKITTPAILDVVPINITETLTIDASRPQANLSNMVLSQDLLGRAVGILPFLNQDGEVGMPAIGLDGNVIYTALKPNRGTGSVSVPGYAVNVTCGSLPRVEPSFNIQCPICNTPDFTLGKVFSLMHGDNQLPSFFGSMGALFSVWSNEETLNNNSLQLRIP